VNFGAKGERESRRSGVSYTVKPSAPQRILLRGKVSKGRKKKIPGCHLELDIAHKVLHIDRHDRVLREREEGLKAWWGGQR